MRLLGTSSFFLVFLIHPFTAETLSTSELSMNSLMSLIYATRTTVSASSSSLLSRLHPPIVQVYVRSPNVDNMIRLIHFLSRLIYLKAGTCSGKKSLRRRANMVNFSLILVIHAAYSVTLTSSPRWRRDSLNYNIEMSKNYDCSYQWPCCK